MRTAALCALTTLLAVVAPSAQTQFPPPGTSLDLTAAEREAIAANSKVV